MIAEKNVRRVSMKGARGEGPWPLNLGWRADELLSASAWTRSAGATGLPLSMEVV